MKRLAIDDLERMCHANPGTVIETDVEQNIAVLTIGRAVFYAELAAVPEACS